MSTPTEHAPIRIEDHVRLVHWVIRRRGFARRAHGALDLDDLEQEGAMGLLRARETYDPARGAWSTYALHWVRHHVQRSLEDTGSTVRIPVWRHHAAARAGKSAYPRVKSLDAPLRGTEDDVTLADVLADPSSPDPDEAIDAKSAPRRLAELFERAKLSPREQLVLKRRAGDATLEEIGEQLALSKERVRQIEARAMARLRKAARVPADAPRVALCSKPKAPPRERVRRKTNGEETMKDLCPVPETAIDY